MEKRQVLPLLKPLLDTTTLIFREFEELQICHREDWLYERYSEIRKLVKLIFKRDGAVGSLETWFDEIITLDQLVNNFNLTLQSNGGDLIELSIEDVLQRFLLSKVDTTACNLLKMETS